MRTRGSNFSREWLGLVSERWNVLRKQWADGEKHKWRYTDWVKQVEQPPSESAIARRRNLPRLADTPSGTVAEDD